MKKKASFIFSDDFQKYRFHEDHPFNQERILLTKELLEHTGALAEENIIAARKATDQEIMLFHDAAYVDAVKMASSGNISEDEGIPFGLGTDDTPIFHNMHEASALMVGGSLTAVDEVMSGRSDHALNLGGGLHHGFKGKASGFCIYNDGAIAIKYIREKYNLKVLYVDTDAHHGDGVQSGFYDDPNVCTFSIHETGRYLFPGTGYVEERGFKEGYGFSYNLPIDAFTQDESFLEAYEVAIRNIIEFFKPDIIITQNGADAHTFDPLTHLCCSMKIYERIPEIAHELAHEYCEGKWVALGGGGYDIWRVVPRAWAQIWNVMRHEKVATGLLPNSWLKKWEKNSPVELPLNWHDTEDAFPTIPRKSEIEEKNRNLLQQLLKYIQGTNIL